MRAPTIQQFRRSFGTHSPVSGRWAGDAYGYHPHGVISRPMVYTDHHHINGHCDAKVMTEPTASFAPIASGRDASIGGSRRNCTPTPLAGTLVEIYRDGKWIGPDGPWRQRMRNDMARVLRQVREIVRSERVERHQREAARKAAQTAEYAAASAAFAA